jgi:hypothetical protein
MKKLLALFLCVMLLACLATSAAADTLLTDIDPGIDPFYDVWDENPQQLPNSGIETEEAWLEGLLGLTYDDPTVELVGKDENPDDGWQTPVDWTYAVLKYGAPQAPDTGLDHYAVWNDDGGSGIDFAGLGLSTHGLSHITYDANPVPEPATMLLLGSGLIGFAGIGRKKIFKK